MRSHHFGIALVFLLIAQSVPFGSLQAADVPPDLGASPPSKAGPSGDLARDSREGGESWDDAVVIASLPYTDAGATCDNADDITLPCAQSAAADVVYRYTPAEDRSIDISLCGSGYDTALGVYDGSHNNLFCNDDFCGLQSEVGNMPVTGGQTYYIVVDGYQASCGSYSLTVRDHVPCSVACPAGSQIEGEPPCVDEYYDDYNGGCQTEGWTPIHPQTENCATMCGRACTYYVQGLSYRDTDNYVVVAQGGEVRVTCTAEFPLMVFLIHHSDCVYIEYDIAFADPCAPATLSREYWAGEEVWIEVTPRVFSGVPESDYVLEVCGIDPIVVGACCYPEACLIRTQHSCEEYDGRWLGPETDCEPNPCGPNPPGACCYADGSCQIMEEDFCTQGQGTWLGAGTDCEPAPCQATPTQATSWGRIKDRFR